MARRGVELKDLKPRARSAKGCGASSRQEQDFLTTLEFEVSE